MIFSKGESFVRGKPVHDQPNDSLPANGDEERKERKEEKATRKRANMP